MIKKTVSELSKLLQSKEISSEELTSIYLYHIEKSDKSIGAYLTICADHALDMAKTIDRHRINGDILPILAGIPMALKDNICTKGIRTTCASKMLSDFVPCYNATVFEHLTKNGAVLLGKLNMDEFAMGSSTEHSAFGLTRNPHNFHHVPGGSSGGCAAAIASNEAPYTLGTDTGGSVRQPASFCGVVGIRPTYGRVSRYGIFTHASSMDQVGVLTKNVRDNALILHAIAGQDSMDATTSSVHVCDYSSSLENGLHNLRIGIPKSFILQHCTDEVIRIVLQAAHRMEKSGAQLVELSSAIDDRALQAYLILASTEAASNLAKYDGIRYGNRTSAANTLTDLYQCSRGECLGSEVKRRIILGTYLLSETQRPIYYEKAVGVRNHIKQLFADAFSVCDIILTPTSPDTAYRFGERSTDPLQMYLADRFTVPASLAGLPAISVPCGTNKNGLPVGLQLTAPAFREDLLYQAAYAYEQEACHETL